jgi:hypothetical protein
MATGELRQPLVANLPRPGCEPVALLERAEVRRRPYRGNIAAFPTNQTDRLPLEVKSLGLVKE